MPSKGPRRVQPCLGCLAVKAVPRVLGLCLGTGIATLFVSMQLDCNQPCCYYVLSMRMHAVRRHACDLGLVVCMCRVSVQCLTCLAFTILWACIARPCLWLGVLCVQEAAALSCRPLFWALLVRMR